MAWRFPRSIRTYLVIPLMMMTLVAIGIVAFSAMQQRKHDVQDAVILVKWFGNVVNNEQNVMLSGAEQLLDSISYIPSVQNHDVKATTTLLAELLRKNHDITNILIADTSGRVWASGLPMRGTIMANDRRYFKNALATGKLSSGEFVIGRVQGKPVLSFGYPLKEISGKVRDIAIISFSLTKYHRLIKTSNLPPRTSLVLTDHNGRILFNENSPQTVGIQDRETLFKYMREGADEGTFEGIGYSGIRRFFAYRKVRLHTEQTPYMYVRVGITREAVLENARKSLILYVSLMASLTFLAFSFATYITRRGIVDKIVALRDATQKVSQGDLDVRVADYAAVGELGELGEAFDAMAQQLRLREEALASSERFLNTIIETEPECVKMLDAEGRLNMMNRAGLAMIEADAFEQVRGHCIYPIVAPEYRDAFINLTNEVFRGQSGSLEFEVVGLKGRRVWLDTHAVPFRNDRGDIVSLLAITRDITERKKAEDERRENLLFIETLMKYSPVGISVFDGESGVCLLANQTAAAIAGEDLGTLQSQNFRTLPSWRESGLLEIAEAVLTEGGASSTEIEVSVPSGKRVTVAYLISTFIAKEKPHLLAISRDVTEEKWVAEEAKKLEAQMLHVQKLESLGILAGGIAHDFNNILMAILGNNELALMKLPPDSPVRANLQNIAKSGQRAADLARQMLAYSGKGRFVIEKLDVNELMSEIYHMLEVSISKKVAIRFNLAPQLPQVEGDATQIRQIIMNLVINGSEAIGDHSGEVTISTGMMECDAAYLAEIWINDKLDGGLYVYLKVADTGCGMDRDTAAKIFDPFFTTKFTGRGLGLAAVLGIVRGHKGAIAVNSELGKGTTFTVLLPATRESSEMILRELASKKPAMGSGTILLVDDEEAVRDLGKEMLETLGYDVLTAENGVAALETYKEHKEEILALILDLTMPRLDGEQTFRMLREIDPDVQVIIASGYSEQEVGKKFVGSGVAGFIQKPYDLVKLGNRLQQVHGKG